MKGYDNVQNDQDNNKGWIRQYLEKEKEKAVIEQKNKKDEVEE